MMTRTKAITIRIPVDVLEQLSQIRSDEGVSVSFQLAKAAESYLKKRKSSLGV